MGTMLYANQYLNEVVASELQPFKEEWFRYYSELPQFKNTFAMIDPAISLEEGSDYTALTVVDVDEEGKWFVRVAQRYKITPTQIVNLVFKVKAQFNPTMIGIESVAFQKALIYMVVEHMKKTGITVPLHEVKAEPSKSKEMKIMGLIPRFEWGRIYLPKGLNDLELELMQFPRSKHDDLIDALASIETFAFTPVKEKTHDKAPHPSHPDYESWFRRNGHRQDQRRDFDDSGID